MEFHLCARCAPRYHDLGVATSSPRDEACHICKGALLQIQKLVAQAVDLSDAFEWSSFSVSSSFPSSCLVREEEIADFAGPGKFTSLKNQINSELSGMISKETGKKNAQRNADAAFEFDFINSKCAARPMPLFLFGRYIKLSRRHCQSRWHCSSCRGKGCAYCMGSGMNYPSVEDEIGKAVLPFFSAKECILHASGREDVDVRCIGGRPFVMEIRSPKKRNEDVSQIELELSKNQHVKAAGLKIVRQGMIDAVCNSHFDKEYSALVSADRPLNAEDARICESLSGSVLLQKTPNRVLSRRADLERQRRVHAVRADLAEGGRLTLRIFAEAGTYIKEFIHSDGGRTTPSLSGALGCKATCEELDVIRIQDYFLETLL